MTSMTFQTRSGVTLHRPILSEAEYLAADQSGFCLACGDFIESGIEPDVRRHPCESCGEHKVFGIEELLLMDILIISDDHALPG